MNRSLQLRSDRAIALCRLALATMLISTSWLDPGYPITESTPGAILLLGYLVYSMLALLIASTDWWLTHRIRPFAFLIDVATAFSVLYLIESAGLGLVSPFMGFFIFLILSTTLIWRTRTVAMVAVGLIGLYGLLGLVLAHNDVLADGHWFGRRMAFMTVLAGLVIWFGHSRNPKKPARLDWPHDASPERRFAIIVEYIQGHMRARRVAIFWTPVDEPWTFLGVAGIPGHHAQRLAPGTITLSAAGSDAAVLFDQRRHRRLHLEDRGRIAARRGPASIDAADYLGIETGMLIPIPSETGEGIILLSDIKGVSADDLQPAHALAGEIGMAIDRHALVEMSHAAQLARLRLALARDLHDSVAQSLAGVSFRLSALGQAWRQGNDIAPELEVLQAELNQEQRNVQQMIARLRSDEGLRPNGRLLDTLTTTLGNAERRWGISTTLDCSCPDALFSSFLLGEVQQLVNEAIANAVKHGKAHLVDVTIRQSDDGLELAIANENVGDRAGDFIPVTISERAETLGGKLAITAANGQTVVTITLPAAIDL